MIKVLILQKKDNNIDCSMTSAEIRQTFLDFFKQKGHTIVSSSPIVNKNDPGLMFTNAGMNQFKDVLLGNKSLGFVRAADSQKCLRVSGKHNDLEEVGHDNYHHTMFEMLGNWSFGDYFKDDAIAFAWELLTEVYKIDKSRLYVTVFGGDDKQGLPYDEEAGRSWKRWIAEDRILPGNLKDNFWEMGEQGPCGPCSEIHVDLRSDEERSITPAQELVNKGNPLVMEIWNLVFIQYNRKADGSLEPLEHKSIDTGMGFERLCRVLQHVDSNYDTDVFSPLISYISDVSGIKYGTDAACDVAMRVVADHVRAITFAITDGQLPSNTGAGYVVRRILRRAVRYAYSALNLKQPFLFELMDVLVRQLSGFYPELEKQHSMCKRVIAEEEQAFLRTLETGIARFKNYAENNKSTQVIDGDFAFELFDTYGFPIDLTSLMAQEINMCVDIDGFNKNLAEQKNRSRKASEQSLSDWVFVGEGSEDVVQETEFCGYDYEGCDVKILKYRRITAKDKVLYHLVFNRTPFYAEMGGEVGDTGVIKNGDDVVNVINTKKENDLIIHIVEKLPRDVAADFYAVVDVERRKAVAANHSATHILQYALRNIVGSHVEQKGSFVGPDYLRFDFSHYNKLSAQEIHDVELFVNDYILADYAKDEQRDVDIEKAKSMGAMALFGEKYGNRVRVIRFHDSVELCGGIHVRSTGNIGVFKIVSESAVAAGIRRIEAVTAKKAFEFLNGKVAEVDAIKDILKSQDAVKGVNNLVEQNAKLKKMVELLEADKINTTRDTLLHNIRSINGVDVVAGVVDVDSGNLKDLAFAVKQDKQNMVVVLGTNKNNKAGICIVITDDLVSGGRYHAGQMIKEAVREINGGGGGQAHFATAGGKSPENIQKAVDKAVSMIG